MQVTVQKLSPVLVEFDVQVDAERVRQEIEKSFVAVTKTAKIRGFRPGKAPRNVVQQMFGARIASDVAQRLVDETFPQAVNDQKIQPISAPAIEPQVITPDQPFSYKARFEVLPEIAEVSFEGLVAKRPKTEVTDAQIDEQLARIQKQSATLQALAEPRPAAKGDVVSIDFIITVAGREVKDAATQDFQVEIGSGTLLGDIDAALVGKNVGDLAEVEVAMPAGHPHPKLKGKTATFAITLKDIKAPVLPAIDDDFAKDVGDFENLEALKANLREQLEKAQKEQSENSVAEQLVAELVKANPIDVPGSLVQQQMQITEQEILQRARMQGSAPRALGDELRAQVRADSEVKVRAGLLMAEIAKRAEIKIGEEQIEEGLKELAEQSGKNIAKLRVEYRERRKREMLIGMILENKVLDLIEAKAQIDEV